MNSNNTDSHIRLVETSNNQPAQIEFYTTPTFSQALGGDYGTWKLTGQSAGDAGDLHFAMQYDPHPPGGFDALNLFSVFGTGNALLLGTLTQGSDRNRKENITRINSASILDKVAGLDISQWNYIDEEIPHIGPMAQDFYAAFGLGGTDKGIASIDSDGIALVAIQALKAENDALKLQLARLAARIDGIMK